MKLNAETNPGDNDSDDRCQEPALVNRVGAGGGFGPSPQKGTPGAGRKKNGFIMSWMNKTTSWVSAKLWSKIAVGYEDEGGFHYGTHPANTEAHEAAE